MSQTTKIPTQTAHTSNPYASLKDIGEVAAYDREKDAALFRELHEVLMKHDAADRFGITLLHHHFEVGQDEWMVETHNPETRELTIKPYRNKELQEARVDLQETNWRFGENGQPKAFLFCVPTSSGHAKII